jgi:hypothetical protein
MTRAIKGCKKNYYHKRSKNCKKNTRSGGKENW